MRDERVPRYFATALRAVRLLRGKTLGQVAAATGVPTWRLRSLERGDGPPDPGEFGRVWDYLASEDDADPEAAR